MVRRSREVGFGINQNNTVVGIHGYGVPLRDRAGTVFGAISVAAPASAFEGVDVAELVATLREEGRLVERAAPPPDAEWGAGREPVRAIPT
jgi:DNA-binding IclR family transcriptional regulator